jgi:predicted O-linked N-acetylglucosamine transferase (SPINDLY family)
LARQPDSTEALNNLGNALQDLGRPREAETCFRHILRLRPDEPDALINLGSALHGQDRPGEAEACYRRALGIRPDSPDAHYNLGNALRDLRRPGEAIESYRRALALKSDEPVVHYNLGNTLLNLGQPAEAEVCFRRALALKPDYPEADNNLGNALQHQGHPDQAEAHYRRALALKPDFPDALNNLGNVLRHLGRLDEAAQVLRRTLESHGDLPEAHNNLGNVLLDLGHPGEAEGHHRRALELRPDFHEVHRNLGSALRAQGRIDEALDCYHRALERQPDYISALDSLLLTLHYRAGVTQEELAAAHAEYQKSHAALLRACWRPFTNDRDPERPLRIGFVSPDFGRHPVGFLLVRVIEALARRPGTVVCYSDRAAAPDDLTIRFRAAASLWRDVAGLCDEKLADLIRADSIDVLIDLAGHTGGNRLLVFARKPAPVQCTWLGYVGTTGLEAIDYLIADRHQIPPGSDQHHCERVLRLSGGYATYDPPADAPDSGPLPALATGRVTFGCFNNPAKLSGPALAAFAAVLRRVPDSRLILKYRGLDDRAVGTRFLQILAEAVVDPSQVELRGGSGHSDHLAAYRDVDIALDTFPYSGGVTTCDALWMGVPVITLPGATFASRHALSHLASVGLTELVAQDADDYVALAAGLARDRRRLADVRAGLRDRVARSPLCDGERLADELLEALRDAWRTASRSDHQTPVSPDE